MVEVAFQAAELVIGNGYLWGRAFNVAWRRGAEWLHPEVPCLSNYLSSYILSLSSLLLSPSLLLSLSLSLSLSPAFFSLSLPSWSWGSMTMPSCLRKERDIDSKLLDGRKLLPE